MATSRVTTGQKSDVRGRKSEDRAGEAGGQKPVTKMSKNLIGATGAVRPSSKSAQAPTDRDFAVGIAVVPVATDHGQLTTDQTSLPKWPTLTCRSFSAIQMPIVYILTYCVSSRGRSILGSVCSGLAPV